MKISECIRGKEGTSQRRVFETVLISLSSVRLVAFLLGTVGYHAS